MTELDISEVAQQSGLPVSTLRYYEERGLIESSGRVGLRRQFDSQVVERLALIALGRTAGFTLDEIGQMFTVDGRPNIDRSMLVAKADELDDTIRRLTSMSESLRHTADCRAPSHMECASFQNLLRAAVNSQQSKTRSTFADRE